MRTSHGKLCLPGWKRARAAVESHGMKRNAVILSPQGEGSLYFIPEDGGSSGGKGRSALARALE
jgi:hypothetical protein